MQLVIDLGKGPWMKSPHALGMAVRFILMATATVNFKLLEINRVLHRDSGGKIPLVPPLYSSGVRYKEEPLSWDNEHFDSIPVVLERKWGDCDDLAPWRAAELRFTGEDRGASIMIKWKKLPDGKRLYHIVVRRSNVPLSKVDNWQFFKDARGVYEDPCRVLGMGGAAARKHQGL